MLALVIQACARNRFLVFTGVLLLMVAGIWSLNHMPLDALPDISDVQVIVHTAWTGEPTRCHRRSGHVSDCQQTSCSAPRKSGSGSDHVRGFVCVCNFR